MTPEQAGSSQDAVLRLYLTLGRVNRALRRDVRDAPVGHGALSALATVSAGDPMRLGALAEAEGVSAASMSRIVSSLEQTGHVRRRDDPQDGRAFLIEPTDAGRDLVTAGRAARMQALGSRMDRLTPQQREALLEALPALEALVD